MPPFTPLEQRLFNAYRRYHVAAQFKRFGLGVAVTVLLAIQNGASLRDAWPLVLAAAWATVREMAPTMPWDTVQQVVRDHPQPAPSTAEQPPPRTGAT